MVYIICETCENDVWIALNEHKKYSKSELSEKIQIKGFASLIIRMLYNDATYYNKEFCDMIDNIYTYLVILKDSRKSLEEKPEYNTNEISNLPNILDYIHKYITPYRGDAYLILVYLANKLKMVEYEKFIKDSYLCENYFHLRNIEYITRKNILDKLYCDGYKIIPIYKKTQEELFLEEYQKKVAYELMLQRKKQIKEERKNYQRMLALQFYNIKKEQLEQELIQT